MRGQQLNAPVLSEPQRTTMPPLCALSILAQEQEPHPAWPLTL